MNTAATYAGGAAYTEADAHLARSDRVMAELVHRLGPITPPHVATPRNLLGALASAIVRQQLSTQAAAGIYKRLLQYFGNRVPTPDQLVDAGADLRPTVGLSHAKERSLRALGARIQEGALDLDSLPHLSDEEVYAALTAVPGIGPWTAGAFMMFRLHRPDVVLPDDLGIRKAARIAYRLERLPSPKALREIAEPWSPYRTRGCLYLWAVPVDGTARSEGSRRRAATARVSGSR